MRRILQSAIEASILRQVLMAIIAIVLFTPASRATTYITLTDERVHVYPDSCVYSVTESPAGITIIARDGKKYTYALAQVSSVSDTLTKVLPTMTTFEFNDKENFQLIGDFEGTIGDDGVISIDALAIGKWLTPRFTLSDDNAVVLVDGKEQHTRENRMSYDVKRVYTVGWNGDLVLAPTISGQYELQPYGNRYTVVVNFLTDGNTRVPRIDINTVGGVNISSKDYYLDAEIIIDGAGIFPSMTDSVQIKGRGHSSWTGNPMGKNAYRLKFAEKVKPLGLTKGKSWVLLSNRKAGSMLTNAIGMKAASLIGTPAPGHIIPVDLYINGTYKGNYNFTEKVGFANNSIDLDDENLATLLKLDTYYDEVSTQKFKSYPYYIPVNVKEPDFSDTASTDLKLPDVRKRFNRLTAAVYNKTDIAREVDLEALARFLTLNEILCNYEIFHPKSTYCYNENVLDDSCKFIFGPGWDFDWAYGFQTEQDFFAGNTSVDMYHYVTMEQTPFMTRLRNDPRVVRLCYQVLKDFADGDIDELCDFVQDYYLYAKPSLRKNCNIWVDNTDYEAQADRAVVWLRQRAMYLLEHASNQVLLRGDVDLNGVVNLNDMTLLIGYLLNGDAGAIDETNADMNGDGHVNVADVTAIISYLLVAE